MRNYRWVCHVCGTGNAPDLNYCSQCKFPAEATALEIDLAMNAKGKLQPKTSSSRISILNIATLTIVLLVYLANLFTLIAIPAKWALNMPHNLVCESYIAARRGWGCDLIEFQYLSLVSLAAFILYPILAVYLKRNFKLPSYLRTIVTSIFVLLAGAIPLRVIYFQQGHASMPYLLWTIPLAIVFTLILYKSKNDPLTKQAVRIKKRLISTQEAERIEVEIEERKRELGKKA